MEIVFGNQKGGVGKTSLSILFASYLVEKGIKTIMIEMDIQQSITSTRAKEVEIGGSAMPPKPYEVIYTKLADYPKIAEKIKNTDINVVIDLPGKLDDPALVPILKNADIIICPFDYDMRSFISTGTFASVIKKLDKDKQIIFVPNRIKGSMNYELKDQVHAELSVHGLITPPISDRAAIKRVSTFGITEEQKTIVGNVFDTIIKNSKIK
jgi:chromosome partitioning protein